MVDGGSDYSEDENQLTQDQKDTMLFTAVKENNLAGTEEALELGASPTYEKDNWSSLMWAACNGNEQIVRILIRNNAHEPYLALQE
jgi:ankyrin repeat protein